MPQVSTAIGTDNFHSVHPMGVVFYMLYGPLNALVKTWPATVRLKFAVALEELRPAIGAGVGAIGMIAQILTTERRLSGFIKEHSFLFRAKVRVLFLFHENSILNPTPKASGLQNLVKRLNQPRFWKGAK
jgi:hypothetical protein